MKRQFANPPAYALAVALCLLLLAPVHARAADEAAAGQWTSVKSKNFLLVGNASEDEIRKVAARLEQFREAFTRLLAVEHFDSSVPTTVMVFRSDAAYKPFEPLYDGKPAGVAGFFQSSPDVDYITLSVDRRGARDADAIAFHEYAHLLVRNNFRNAPLWFNEGLAEYYSTFEISDGNRKVKLGKAIDYRVRTLRGRELLPLGTLFNVDEKSAHYNEPEKRGLFYAESWALVHYLLSGERRSQLSTFLDLLAKGAGLEDSFRQAFQTSYTGMETELRQYIQLNKYRQQVMTFEKRLDFDSLITSAPLTRSEAEFYLGDLLLHTNRLDEADAYLQRAVALNPRLAAAQASLGVLRARQNRLQDAKEHLKLASAANPQNYLVHYYHAYVLTRANMWSDDDTAEGYFDAETVALMRAELKKAIELAPHFAEAYRLLAFINIARDEQLDDAITLLKQAINLSPRRKDFSLLLAQGYMRKEEFDTARAVLSGVVQGNVNNQVREQAQALLAIVKSREELAARVKKMNEMAMKAETPTGPVQPCDAPQPGPQLKRLRFAGEQVCGMLVRVECADDGSVILFIEAGERTFRLRGASLNRIRFVTYTSEVRGHVTCGLREPASPVLITYKPAAAGAVGVDGEAVAVEFVPRDWKANH